MTVYACLLTLLQILIDSDFIVLCQNDLLPLLYIVCTDSKLSVQWNASIPDETRASVLIRGLSSFQRFGIEGFLCLTIFP